MNKIPGCVQIKSQPLANKILGEQIKPFLLVEIVLFRHEIKTTPYLVFYISIIMIIIIT